MPLSLRRPAADRGSGIRFRFNKSLLNRIASEYDKEDFLAIRYLAALLRGSSF
jgi:hypothetical protein